MRNDCQNYEFGQRINQKHLNDIQIYATTSILGFRTKREALIDNATVS